MFPAAKAKAAENLIDALIVNHKQVHFAKDLDEKELSQLLDGALGLASDGQGEEAFTTVESRNSRKKRKKVESEKKAAAAAKKAAEQAEAAADARVAKAAVKAAADLLRQNGAGAWAQPLPRQQGGGGWGHRPNGGAGPAPPAQRVRSADHTNRTPAVVVFGDGSKTSLKRALKRLDPKLHEAISAVYMIKTGTPRAVVLCRGGPRDGTRLPAPAEGRRHSLCCLREEARRRQWP